MKRLLPLVWATCILIGKPAFGEIPKQTPQNVRKKYEYLYKLNPITNADGSVSFHNAKLFRRDGINILSLKGDRFEMAYQHGRLLKKEIHQGALPQAAMEFENTVRNGLPGIPVVTNVILKFLQKKYPQSIVEAGLAKKQGEAGLDEVLAEGYGLSDGADLPLQDILLGMVAPESLQVFLGEHLSRRSLLSRVAAPAASPAQCSAFSAWGNSTRSGEMIIGRNTDYPLNGYFDKFPTVIYYHPSDDTQRYMAVSSAGLHNSGVVGFNESGIYLGVHTIPTTDVSTEGVPVFLLAQEALRKSKTFDEAVAVFRKYKPAAGWTYMLVSTRERRVASIELNNQNMEILESSGESHVQTNHYRSEKMKPSYLHVNVAIDDDTISRMNRVKELLAASKGKLDVAEAISILGDKFDPIFGKVRGVGNVVSVHTTMTSVVMKPESGKLYVAAGQAPVSTSPYVELPLVGQFDPETFLSGTYQVTTPVPYVKEHEAIAKAEQFFIEAKIQFESKCDPAGAYSLMKKAIALDDTNPSYHFVAGILALKAKNFSAALPYFEKLSTEASDHYLFLGKYYRARVNADAGNTNAARKDLEEILQMSDKVRERRLRTACEEVLKKMGNRYPIKPGSLALMMQQADMTTY